MVMRNKKGFTLVELLAVLVVLAVIVLLAVNIINSRVKEARKNSVEVNANNYVKAVNGVAAISQNVGEDMEKGTYQVRDLNKNDIKISGEKPRKGYLVIDNYEVSYGCLMYDTYSAIILNGKTSSVEKMNCNDFKTNAEYEYKGSEETFKVAIAGTYKIEIWGAQGGSVNYNSNVSEGGYGGYSVGYVDLNKGDILYINVGGTGSSNSLNSGNTISGGYNGGGSNESSQYGVGGSGGGATSIATKSGLLKTLSSDTSKIVMVAGGGGAGGVETGNSPRKSYGGSGGGYAAASGSTPSCPDSPGAGGNQSTGNAFGAGVNNESWYGAGGGGYYGGKYGCGSGGGSGYIGYSKLYNAAMYCYNCTISNLSSTKTVSTSCAEEDPTSKCAKKGNGYVKITYSPEFESANDITEFAFTNGEQILQIDRTGIYRLEVWGAQGGSVNNSYVGGYGAYSVGEINLTKGTKLYINVGGTGSTSKSQPLTGGYNGGGNSHGSDCAGNTNRWGASGGGATSIATKSGELKTLDETKDKNSILIIAGGGGGAFNIADWQTGSGGSAGGFTGNVGYHTNRNNRGAEQYAQGGTQTSGGRGGDGWEDLSVRTQAWLNITAGKFGLGGSSPDYACGEGGGGGGGLYGGGGGAQSSGGGGSGYIANLTNAAMYCYNCTQDTNSSTYTYSVNQALADPTPQKAKTGNGYAKITFIN